MATVPSQVWVEDEKVQTECPSCRPCSFLTTTSPALKDAESQRTTPSTSNLPQPLHTCSRLLQASTLQLFHSSTSTQLQHTSTITMSPPTKGDLHSKAIAGEKIDASVISELKKAEERTFSLIRYLTSHHLLVSVSSTLP